MAFPEIHNASTSADQPDLDSACTDQMDPESVVESNARTECTSASILTKSPSSTTRSSSLEAFQRYNSECNSSSSCHLSSLQSCSVSWQV